LFDLITILNILRYLQLMKRIYLITILLLLFIKVVNAQDAVLISEDNFVRGVIQGTNFSSVSIINDDQTITQYQAKDVKSFVWNGETYVSKPIVAKKKMQFLFFKVIESGTVNLYAFGDNGLAAQPSPQRVKVRPSFGVGVGSGNFGGGGIGGGISIGLGGGRRNDEPTSTIGKVSYFIERPGAGPLQEIKLNGAKISEIRAILLQKLTSDEDLAASINATESFDAKNLAAYVKAYNTHK
jgi:hypothetical protein